QVRRPFPLRPRPGHIAAGGQRGGLADVPATDLDRVLLPRIALQEVLVALGLGPPGLVCLLKPGLDLRGQLRIAQRRPRRERAGHGASPPRIWLIDLAVSPPSSLPGGAVKDTESAMSTIMARNRGPCGMSGVVK